MLPPENRTTRPGGHRRPARAAPRRLGPLGIAASVVLLCLAASPRASSAADEQELELARGQYESAQYQDAAARFGRLLDAKGNPCPTVPELTPEGCRLTDAAILQRARGYYANVLVALGREAEADQQFELLLRQSPTFSPSPAIFPQKVIDRFLKVREKMEAELAENAKAAQKRKQDLEEARARYDAWVVDIQKRAETETVVEVRSRWIAAVPFGVGQFHNGDVGIGGLFLGLETVATGTAIVTGFLHNDLTVRRGETCSSGTFGSSIVDRLPCPEVDQAALVGQIQDLQIANNIALGALAALLIAGFVEAQVSFVEEVPLTRKRAIPPRPPVPEAASATVIGVPGAPDAAGLGMSLRF